ncbi:MAG: glycosyltransferase family 4 protein [Candidatus Pacebacteria bacterium]|nr:glycosyltransferase family 4 protein [Candidatus Paceibacterota bacterium]
MKIVIATPIYPPEIGGPATYTKELCERLHNTHNITVVAYTDVGESFEGTKLVRVSKHRPLPVRLLRYFMTLFREARGADLIYVQNAMAAGLPTALACMILRKPFVLKFVGDEAWERATQKRLTTKRLEEFLATPDGTWKIRAMMLIQGWVLRRAACVTTPSAYLSEELIKAYGVRRERAVVNYNAAEETEVLPFEPTPPVPHQIAVTARLTAWKGIDGIIRAMKIVLKKFPDARVIIAGDGPETDSLKQLARDTGVEDAVSFLGKVSRAETWHIRKNSSVYILNSTYEGLPHTVLTSFAAGIPVIATDISGTNEAVYDGKTGLLVKPGDDVALAAAIEKLFTDPALYNGLVDGGMKLLKEKFSWEGHLEGLAGIFEKVVRK